jgi:hypothetical protein
MVEKAVNKPPHIEKDLRHKSPRPEHSALKMERAQRREHLQRVDEKAIPRRRAAELLRAASN